MYLIKGQSRIYRELLQLEDKNQNPDLKKKNRQKLTDTDRGMVVTRGKGGGAGVEKGKGVKYMVTEGDLASDGEHTMQHIHDVELYL